MGADEETAIGVTLKPAKMAEAAFGEEVKMV